MTAMSMAVYPTNYFIKNTTIFPPENDATASDEWRECENILFNAKNTTRSSSHAGRVAMARPSSWKAIGFSFLFISVMQTTRYNVSTSCTVHVCHSRRHGNS